MWLRHQTRVLINATKLRVPIFVSLSTFPLFLPPSRRNQFPFRLNFYSIPPYLPPLSKKYEKENKRNEVANLISAPSTEAHTTTNSQAGNCAAARICWISEDILIIMYLAINGEGGETELFFPRLGSERELPRLLCHTHTHRNREWKNIAQLTDPTLMRRNFFSSLAWRKWEGGRDQTFAVSRTVPTSFPQKRRK